MHRPVYVAALAATALLLMASATTADTKNHDATPEALHVVTFIAQSPNAPVDVYTDSNPQHWREWTVISTDSLYREDRCRFRVDASRVLRDKPLTQGIPNRCLTRWQRKHLRPDPAPTPY